MHHPNSYSSALFEFSFCRFMTVPTNVISSIQKNQMDLRSLLHITTNYSRLSSHRPNFPGNSIYILRQYLTVLKLNVRTIGNAIVMRKLSNNRNTSGKKEVLYLQRYKVMPTARKQESKPSLKLIVSAHFPSFFMSKGLSGKKF